uniref:Vacuolar protein sorting-associated protein 33B-like n=1 Tax=Hirondellea gigas TaxID=1518452 RepID=A0A2P2I572_9CRUS
MSGLCDRNKNGVDVWLLREIGCRGLVCCLEEIPGKKDLVIDTTLMKMLDRLAQATTLRKHDVDKIYRLERVPPTSLCPQRIYLTRSTPEAIKLIAEHINHHLQQQQQQERHPQQHQQQVVVLSKVLVLCVPRVTYAAKAQLEEEGLAGGGLVSLHPFCPGFVPLDDDLLTLEMPTFFRDAFVEGDLSACVGIGQSLTVLHSLYGSPKRTLAHGRAAHAVVNAVNTLAVGNDGQTRNNTKCEIGQLFVLDRDADLVTPLLTQLTYEGSIDEHFGIQAGVVELPSHVTAEEGKPGPSKLMLNSKDAVFESIRNKHFAGVAGQLVRRAKEIHSKKEESEKMKTAQLKEFVANDLRELKTQQRSISLHLSVCEAITGATKRDFDVQLTTEHGLVTGATSASEAKIYFEDCCARQMPSNTCLRLLCLLSLTQSNGLSCKEFETLSSQLVAASGYRHLNTLFDLRQAGFLSVAESLSAESPQAIAMKGLRQAASNLINREQTGSWRSLCKLLKLIPDPDEPIELHNPSHMSYVFNGAYTPGIPQLVSQVLTKGVQSVSEALKLLPGTTITEGWESAANTPNSSSAPALPPPVVLVLVLGGVTFAEIAAFKLLGLRTGNRIIVASTGTCTGNKIMSSITQPTLV